jgi:hypothetical protein
MTTSPAAIADHDIVILRSAAGDPDEAVYSLIDVLNELHSRHVRRDEVSRAATRHYFVDYYLAQVNNGGHSQWLANTAGPGQAELFDDVEVGLADAGHEEAIAIWADFRAVLAAIPADQLAGFFEGDYLDADGFHPLEQLAPLDDRFFEITDALSTANGRRLLARPELVVLDDDQLPAYVEARVARIPDLAARQQAALDAEPSYVKAARAYAAEQGLEFDRVTAGDPVNVDGAMLVEWYFLASGRLFSLVELPDGTVRHTER